MMDNSVEIRNILNYATERKHDHFLTAKMMMQNQLQGQQQCRCCLMCRPLAFLWHFLKGVPLGDWSPRVGQHVTPVAKLRST